MDDPRSTCVPYCTRTEIPTALDCTLCRCYDMPGIRIRAVIMAALWVSLDIATAPDKPKAGDA